MESFDFVNRCSDIAPYSRSACRTRYHCTLFRLSDARPLFRADSCNPLFGQCPLATPVERRPGWPSNRPFSIRAARIRETPHFTDLFMRVRLPRAVSKSVLSSAVLVKPPHGQPATGRDVRKRLRVCGERGSSLSRKRAVNRAPFMLCFVGGGLRLGRTGGGWSGAVSREPQNPSLKVCRRIGF